MSFEAKKTPNSVNSELKTDFDSKMSFFGFIREFEAQNCLKIFKWRQLFKIKAAKPEITEPKSLKCEKSDFTSKKTKLDCFGELKVLKVLKWG